MLVLEEKFNKPKLVCGWNCQLDLPCDEFLKDYPKEKDFSLDHATFPNNERTKHYIIMRANNKLHHCKEVKRQLKEIEDCKKDGGKPITKNGGSNKFLEECLNT